MDPTEKVLNDPETLKRVNWLLRDKKEEQDTGVSCVEIVEMINASSKKLLEEGGGRSIEIFYDL